MSHTTEGGEQASVTLSVGQPLQLRTWYYICASVEWENSWSCTSAPCVVVEQMQLKNGKRDQMTAQSHSLDLSASSFERVRETPLLCCQGSHRFAGVVRANKIVNMMNKEAKSS